MMTTDREEGASLPRASFKMLAKRLIGSFHPAPPEPAELAWVRSLLTREEFDLWSKLSPHDQIHSVAVGIFGARSYQASRQVSNSWRARQRDDSVRGRP